MDVSYKLNSIKYSIKLAYRCERNPHHAQGRVRLSVIGHKNEETRSVRAKESEKTEGNAASRFTSSNSILKSFLDLNYFSSDSNINGLIMLYPILLCLVE